MGKFSSLMMVVLTVFGSTSLAENSVERALYESDLLQAKLILTRSGAEGIPLALAFLERAGEYGSDGEVEFYEAIAQIKLTPQKDRSKDFAELVLRLLDNSVKKGEFKSGALLYRIYSEPFLVSEIDQKVAALYRKKFHELQAAQEEKYEIDMVLGIIEKMLR